MTPRPAGRRLRPAQPGVPDRFAAQPVDLAVDLGCGPGHTTRLVASVVRPRQTLGLDQSASFVALAEIDAPPGIAYAVHDVTVVPFPCPPAGFVYGRFLLTHLHDPRRRCTPGRPSSPRRAAAGGRGRADPHLPADPAPLPRGGGSLLAYRGHRLEVGAASIACPTHRA